MNLGILHRILVTVGRAFAAWLTILAMASAFVGCGPDSGPTTQAQAEPPKSGSASIERVEPAPQEPALTETRPATEKAATNNSSNPSLSSDTAVSATASDKTASAPATIAAVPKPVPVEVNPSTEQLTRWAIAEYEPFRLLTCYDGFKDPLVQCLAVAPDGKHFALGGMQLTLWNTTESKPVVDLLTNATGTVERPILSMAISPDGKWLASGDSGGQLRIWNMQNQTEVVSLNADDGDVSQVAFSPNSQLIATTNYSGVVRLWQTADGKPVKSLKVGEREQESLLFVSDSLLASVGDNAVLWNIESDEKSAALSPDRLMGSGLALSDDRRWLAFADDKGIALWDVQKATAGGLKLRGHSESIHEVDFSSSGKWMATSVGATIHIWNAANGQTVQVIDADGGTTTDLEWLPQGDLLLLATESGRVRIWGTPEIGNAIGLQPIKIPVIELPAVDDHKPASWAQLHGIIDVRSFPRLPGAEPQYQSPASASYSVRGSLDDAQLFYRYHLRKAGWKEATGGPNEQGLFFSKDGCSLNVSITASPTVAVTDVGELTVSLFFTGNVDVRWLPKYSGIEEGSDYSFQSTAGYFAKADITDLEVSLLKQYHDAGWTPYTRLAVSTSEEEEDFRSIDLLQGGCELSVFMRPPADRTDVISVQTSIGLSNNSVPIPQDVGWFEYDGSTDMMLAATTKMGFDETRKFYDLQMRNEGWLARESGIDIDEGKGWFPYIRGQQDVVIQLETLPEGQTRIYVGDGERWQAKEPPAIDPEITQNGIEAADFSVPPEATDTKFSPLEKYLNYTLGGVGPIAAAEQCGKQLAPQGWKRDKFGVVSDEYTNATFMKGKAEIEFRATLREGKDSDVQISGSGLLWTKPLPVDPKRISYGAWLTRKQYVPTLDRLDEFATEMRAIPLRHGK